MYHKIFLEVKLWIFSYASILTIILIVIETPFNTFANRADPDQTALVRAAWSDLLCLLMEIWYIWSYTNGSDK